MLVPKILFVLTTAAGAAWGRWQNVFFDSVGVDPALNSFIKALGFLFKGVGYPAWGFFADTAGVRTALLASILSSCFFLGLFQSSWILSSSALIAVVKMARSTSNGVYPLVDSFTLSEMASSNEGYGSSRLWCSVSWGLSGLVLGVLIDATSMSAIFYWTYGFVAVEVLVVLFFVPNTVPARRKDHAPSFWEASSEIVSSKARVLLLVALLQGVVMQVPETLLFLHLERDVHVSRSFLGLCTLVSVTLEIPIFLSSQWLLERFSAKRLVLCSQTVLVVRLVGYWWSHHRWVVLVGQLSHGLCFALFWTAAVSLNASASPRHLLATSHSAFTSAYSVVGASMGLVLWGVLYEHFGARVVFISSALLMLVTLVFCTPQLHRLQTSSLVDVLP